MYLQHFGLATQPFGVTPDPSFLYESAAHREALASLINSIESGLGFSSLIGDPGLGKTTLLYALLERYAPDSRTAFIFTARSRGDELVRQILDDFEVSAPKHDVNAMYAAFRDMLVTEASAGRKVILLLDEAQALSPSALDAVRLLSNFETRSSKLLQVVIAGHSELDDILNQPKLAALQQRISKSIRLRPLTFAETRQYIDHRLQLAGAGCAAIFTPGAITLVAQKSEGIPRSINRLCMNAMTIACAFNSKQVNEAHVLEAAKDLESGITHAPKSENGPVLVTQSPVPIVGTPPPIATHTWGSQALAMAPLLITNPKPTAEPTPSASKPKVKPAPSKPPVAAPEAQPALPLSAPAAEPAPAILVPAAERPSRIRIPVANDPVLTLRSDVREEPWIPLPIVEKQRSYMAIVIVAGVLLSAVGIGVVARRSTPNEDVTLPSPPLFYLLPKAPSSEELLSSTINPKHRQARDSRSSSRAHTGSMDSNAIATANLRNRPPLPVPPRKGSYLSGNLDSNSGLTIKATPVERSENVPHITPAVLLVRTKPAYPEEARAERLRGEVKLRLHVDKTGHVSSVIVLSGDHRLADSAESAVRQWLFTPFQQDGVPMPGDTTVSLQFPPAE